MIILGDNLLPQLTPNVYLITIMIANDDHTCLTFDLITPLVPTDDLLIPLIPVIIYSPHGSSNYYILPY